VVEVVGDGRSVAHCKVDLGEWYKEDRAPADPVSFSRGARWRSTTTDDQGNARFRGVLAGDVQVCVDEDEATEQRVHLEPGGAAQVRLCAR